MTDVEEKLVRRLYANKLSLWAYCTAAVPLEYRKWNGKHPSSDDANFEIGTWPAGKTLKIVMVSRFDDCGLTDDLQAKTGYHCRVSWDSGMIMNIREKP